MKLYILHVNGNGKRGMIALLWDGKAGERIANIIVAAFEAEAQMTTVEVPDPQWAG
jgi:hypothetical protein